jgi:alanine dehydrogenase
MNRQPTLLLRRSEVAVLLTMDACIAAVEQAFRLYGEGKAAPPGVLGVHVERGGFHIKAGVLGLSRSYFAAKVNANFPQNRQSVGLPTIQGVIVLCDAENGKPLAVMDSMEITAQRTAAATAVAAKYLARPDSVVATICGCGSQGRVQLRALLRVLPLRKVFAFDSDSDQVLRFSEELGAELKIEVKGTSNLENAVGQSDVCVTCTTSRQPLLALGDVRPGTFIAAVGADNPEKQELQPALMAASKVVTDVTEQCASIGDLHHAIAAGVMKRIEVHAELGEVVAGSKSGRTSPEEITIFDSTGMALQDVAAAALAYEKAVTAKCGLTLDLAA